MSAKSREILFQEVLDVVRNEPDACELKWALFYGAVISGNPSIIKPFPEFFLDKTTNEPLVETLQETARQVPALEELPGAGESLPEAVIELLHWILIKCKNLQLKRIAPSNYPEQLQKALSTKPPSQWPQYVYQVLANPDSNAEKKFQEHKRGPLNSNPDSQFLAFHGSKLESFFSILNFGLAQHLCKRDLYGDGAYLSTEMDVALNFTSKGLAWPHSHLLSNDFSCLALCEYVPNPLYIRSDPKKVPKSYIVLTNNEIVRVRYVLVFTKAKRRRRQTSSSTSSSWTTGAKITMGVIFYICLLGLVGIYNRKNFLKDQLWSLWD